VRDIRRSGSCAVDLCSVAAGRLDAFYETGVNWWDVAAGIRIVRSAGGVATYEPDLKRIFASGPALWEQLISAVNQAEVESGSQSSPPSANI
ncbi:MAG: inositol monophosphatase family protein, partial [Actinomycetota bacterium]|nr:inositol monophosphatase family protein [Actinomycetota bacterium]